MLNVILAIVALLAVVLILGGVLGWLRSGTPQRDTSTSPTKIDADTIGRTVGMLGGDITDAAVVQYALDRKEATTGTPSTQADAVFAASMLKAMKPPKAD